MDRKTFFQAVKNKMVRGVYLFEGIEENIKASALAALRSALLPQGMEDLNETVMENPAASAVIAAA